MTRATLCFLVKGQPVSEILLGLKKAGFGAGKYNGLGGKIQAGETVESAAIREVEEEAGVKISEMQDVGRLTFLFPARPEWNQVVHVFLARSWKGEPAESNEMKPAWFSASQIPFERMWQDDSHWLPLVLGGARVRASFTFKDDNESIDHVEMEEW